jgi:hypothetical protein
VQLLLLLLLSSNVRNDRSKITSWRPAYIYIYIYIYKQAKGTDSLKQTKASVSCGTEIKQSQQAQKACAGEQPPRDKQTTYIAQ